jgi:hypothetical protein
MAVKERMKQDRGGQQRARGAIERSVYKRRICVYAMFYACAPSDVP